MSIQPQIYRLKPETVEAVQWDGTPEMADRLMGWAESKGATANLNTTDPMNPFIRIKAGKQIWIINVGDFLHRNNGKYYVVPANIFLATYELVTP